MKKRLNIPKRSSLWFDNKKDTFREKVLFDFESIVFSCALILFVILIFGPIIFQITFNEVFATPLVPALLTIFSIINIQTIESLRFIYLAAFIIISLGIYLLVRDYLQRQIPAILATIIFLIPPPPF